jgi:hypothetical protein
MAFNRRCTLPKKPSSTPAPPARLRRQSRSQSPPHPNRLGFPPPPKRNRTRQGRPRHPRLSETGVASRRAGFDEARGATRSRSSSPSRQSPPYSASVQRRRRGVPVITSTRRKLCPSAPPASAAVGIFAAPGLPLRGAGTKLDRSWLAELKFEQAVRRHLSLRRQKGEVLRVITPRPRHHERSPGAMSKVDGFARNQQRFERFSAVMMMSDMGGRMPIGQAGSEIRG